MDLAALIQGHGFSPTPTPADSADPADVAPKPKAGGASGISSARGPRADAAENQRHQHASAARQQTAQAPKPLPGAASKASSAKSAGSAEIGESEKPQWPVAVKVGDPAEYADLALDDNCRPCAACARLVDAANWRGFPDQRCAASPMPYFPVPDLPRHCPFNAFIPRS